MPCSLAAARLSGILQGQRHHPSQTFCWTPTATERVACLVPVVTQKRSSTLFPLRAGPSANVELLICWILFHLALTLRGRGHRGTTRHHRTTPTAPPPRRPHHQVESSPNAARDAATGSRPRSRSVVVRRPRVGGWGFGELFWGSSLPNGRKT